MFYCNFIKILFNKNLQKTGLSRLKLRRWLAHDLPLKFLGIKKFNSHATFLA